MATGITSRKVDPIYPAEYALVTNTSTATEFMDVNMGLVNEDGLYNYYFSPIAQTNSWVAKTAALCRDHEICGNPGQKTFILNEYKQSEYPVPVGLALDGHIVWGPFKSKNFLWG